MPNAIANGPFATRSLTMQGEAGPIQAELELHETPTAHLAILCHPHPEYGGSMDDAVLSLARDVLLANGIGCLRFNFRGVGSSAGTYDGAQGEARDLLTVINSAQQDPGYRMLSLVGYSFGSIVVSNAVGLGVIPDLEKIILIAPPNASMPLATLPAIPTAVIYGANDDFVDPAGLPHTASVAIHSLPNCDHFFGYASELLANALRASI